MCKSSDGQDITTPFCKCRSKPVAGQKGWVSVYQPDRLADILAIVDDSVMYRYQDSSIPRATSANFFLQHFKPPKPKPREIWVASASNFVWNDKAKAPPYAIHYREVVED